MIILYLVAEIIEDILQDIYIFSDIEKAKAKFKDITDVDFDTYSKNVFDY